MSTSTKLRRDQYGQPPTPSSQPALFGKRAAAAMFSEAEVAVLTQLEGRPWPSTEQFAATIGTSRAEAKRVLLDLRRNGVCGPITRKRPDPDVCDCVVYIKAQLSNPARVEELDLRLNMDPFVRTAVRLSGDQDYRIEATHCGVAEAHFWFRGLLTDPAVCTGTLLITRNIVLRHGTVPPNCLG